MRRPPKKYGKRARYTQPEQRLHAARTVHGEIALQVRVDAAQAQRGVGDDGKQRNQPRAQHQRRRGVLDPDDDQRRHRDDRCHLQQHRIRETARFRWRGFARTRKKPAPPPRWQARNESKVIFSVISSEPHRAPANRSSSVFIMSSGDGTRYGGSFMPVTMACQPPSNTTATSAGIQHTRLTPRGMRQCRRRPGRHACQTTASVSGCRGSRAAGCPAGAWHIAAKFGVTMKVGGTRVGFVDRRPPPRYGQVAPPS